MDVVIQVLVLMWIVFLVVTLRWARITSRGASIATWLGLTAVSWWFEFLFAFFALHAILFSLGREAAVVGAIVTVAIVTSTPAAWAYGLGHRNKHRSAHN
jgi:hypothetical protein